MSRSYNFIVLTFKGHGNRLVVKVGHHLIGILKGMVTRAVTEAPTLAADVQRVIVFSYICLKDLTYKFHS